MIKVKPGREKDIPFAKDKLLSMKDNIDVLLDVSVEIDMRHSSASYDLLLMTKFRNMEDLEKYLVDPYHQDVSEYIIDMKESGASVCYEI